MRTAPSTTSETKKDQGFTLIELLVVVVIIGILAAVAIPVFLNQREKAMDAGVKSDLKNLASLQETYLVDNPTGYAGTLAPLQATPYSFKESEAGSISVVSGNATAYCLSGKAANSSTTYYYDSDGGGLSETVCS